MADPSPAQLSQSLRMPKDATVGSVEYAPRSAREILEDPRAQMAMALAPVPIPVGRVARAVVDRRINKMFDPSFWRVFGRRGGD